MKAICPFLIFAWWVPASDAPSSTRAAAAWAWVSTGAGQVEPPAPAPVDPSALEIIAQALSKLDDATLKHLLWVSEHRHEGGDRIVFLTAVDAVLYQLQVEDGPGGKLNKAITAGADDNLIKQAIRDAANRRFGTTDHYLLAKAEALRTGKRLALFVGDVPALTAAYYVLELKYLTCVIPNTEENRRWLSLESTPAIVITRPANGQLFIERRVYENQGGGTSHGHTARPLGGRVPEGMLRSPTPAPAFFQRGTRGCPT